MKFNSISEALIDLRRGKLIIVADDENRENEGDFIGSADKCTPEMINFMATHGRGLICTAISSKRAEELKLSPMVSSEDNDSAYSTPFTVSVDFKHGTTTGISAEDRSKTVKALADSRVKEENFFKPGHVFPLVASAGGVFEREGHTEATVDLMDLAGLSNAGVLCEIMNKDGSMARVPDLFQIAKKFGLKIITIKDLINYKLRYESRVQRVVSVDMPTKWGEFELIAFRDVYTNREHLALVKGAWGSDEDVLVRIHSECLTGDVFGSSRCDCGDQLAISMRMIEQSGAGIVVYMREEGRGIGLFSKLKAYSLQEAGLDTVQANRALGYDADHRDFSVAANILYALNVERVQLITNNLNKCSWMEGYGINIVGRIPVISSENGKHHKKYLETKVEKMGHVINLKK